MHHAKLPTLKYVRELLDYNPSSGVFTRKISKGGKSVGSVAGSIDRDGRRRITLKGVKYFSSRIAWLFLTGQDSGDAEIDHINRNRSDDSQVALAESCVAAHQRGAKVFISNSTAPRVIELYERHGFTLHRVNARRSISSKGSTRETANDIVASLGI